MSRDRSLSALTGEAHRLVAAAEQDLARTLSLEPSADFAAKVRARIRDAERPAAWRGHGVPGLAVAASIVVVAGVAMMMFAARHRPEVQGASVTTQAARHEVSRAAGDRGAPSPERRIPPPGSRVLFGMRRNPEPGSRMAHETVLIDTSRRDAVDRLLAMVRSGVRDLPAAATEDPAHGLDVPPVVVEQLEVPLLPVSGAANERSAERR